MTKLLQTLWDGISVGSLYALIALGYTMVYGVLQFINFAHGDVFMIGAWVTFWVCWRVGWVERAHASWGRALAVLLAAMAACGVIGFLIERLAYRPLRSAPRLNILITAIGVSLLLENVGQLRFVFGTDPQGVPPLLPGGTLLTVGGVNVTLIDVLIIACSQLLMAGLVYIVYSTRLGLAMRAVAFDTRTAALMGVNVNRTISICFVMGSVLAGAAGFLYAAKYTTLNQPAFNTWTLLGLTAFVAAVVGGIGNIRGAMLGGLLIGLLEQFGVAYVSSDFKDVYVFSVLILVLLVKPTGILGRAVVEKVYEMESIPARARTLAPSRWLALPQGMIVPVAGVALAVALQFYAQPLLGDYRSKILLDIGINIILAVSLNIVNGFTGQFSIGHAGFMAVGGYTAGCLMYYGSMRIWGDAGAHGALLSWTGHLAEFPTAGAHAAWQEWFNGGDALFLGALVLGGLVAAFFGLLVGLPSLRLRGDYLAIVTLGFGEIVRAVLESSKDLITDPDEVRRTSLLVLPVHLGGSTGLTNQPYYTTQFWVWSFVTLTVLTAYRIKTSTFGRAFLSIRENEIAAEAIGVPTTRYKVQAFVLAAFFAGVAGGLYAHELGTSLAPGDLGFMKSFDIVIMVVLGGMGSISGAVLAAALLTILPEWLRQPTHIWPVGIALIVALLAFRRGRPSRMTATLAGLTLLFEAMRFISLRYHVQLADYRMILYALALILVMILRPQGFFGVYEVWDTRRLWRAGRRPKGVAA